MSGSSVWLAVSIVILAFVAWSWIGRGRGARWWVGWGNVYGRGADITLTALPAVGLIIFALALYSVIGSVVAPVSALLFIAAVAIFIIGLFRPHWWGPRWYREYRKAVEGTAYGTGR